MPFSKTVTTHRQIALGKLLCAAPSTRSALRPILMRYIAALHDAERVFLDETSAERDAAVAAQTAAHKVFQTTVNAGSDTHEALMNTLAETDEVARREATAIFHNILRSANAVYDRAVNPTAIVLKAIEARATIAYEVAARKAFDLFESELKAASTINLADNRSTCHAGCDRFVLQEAGGKR